VIESVAGSTSLSAELGFTAWLRRNALVWVAGALYACAVFVGGAQEVEQDSWLSLSGGRDIARHGLPWHDRLTTLTNGAHWVDQQWLGKLFLYGLTVVGGLSLLFLVHVAFVLAGFVGAMAIARRRGAGDRAVFWVAAATIPTAPWAWQLRAQSLAYVLFVAVLGLLASDSARPSRRVWLVFPLLALWANVHGSVTLGVALTVLAGVVQVARRRLRGFSLATGGALCLFASPYGFDLVHYYRSLLFNPLLEHFVGEWQPSASPGALPFFALALAVTWLVGRHWRALGWFERLALALTAAAGFTAFRGIVWFLLAMIVLVPKLLDAEFPHTRPAPRLLVATAVLCGLGALFTGGTAVAKLSRKVAAGYPNSVAAIVEEEAVAQPNLRVFASERYADWLLWKDPALAGRLVYDIRFELFNRSLFDQLLAFHDQTGPHWRQMLHGARLLVLYRKTDGRAAQTLRHEAGARVLAANHDLVVILRPKR
jgi:hypothetical protein